MLRHPRYKRQVRLLLLRWHRWCGAVAALLVVLATLSGILINHAHSLGWDHRPLRAGWLLALYGVEPEIPRTGYNVNGVWLARVSNQLYWNFQALGDCRGGLAGAVAVEGGVAAQCGNGLYLLTSEGELLEQLFTPSDAMQSDATQTDAMQKFGISAGKLILQGAERSWAIDIDEGHWHETEAPQSVAWAVPQSLPGVLAVQLGELALPSDLSWERVLLDFHSGRLFGDVGILVMDIVGVIMLFLASSGLWVWITRPKH